MCDCNKNKVVIVQEELKKPINNQAYSQVTWTGSLLDIQKMNINLNSVLKITKIKENEYVAMITNSFIR